MSRSAWVVSVLSLAVSVLGCSNECKDAAKNYTDLAAACGALDVTYEFTGECDSVARDCIAACDFLSDNVCETEKTTTCINACIGGEPLGGGTGTGGAGTGGATN